jgi:uroporphyrin-3 C-methyltransferase
VAPSPKRGSSAVAWLALLLVLALAGGAGWYVMTTQQREKALEERLAEVEAQASGRREERSFASAEALEQLGERLRQELRAGLSELESAAGRQESEAGRQAASIGALGKQLTELRAELARFSAADRDSWLLAEAEYLLRLANQRLIMAGDTASAQVLLTSADQIMRELDEASLYDARGAVAADLAAVRALPSVDVEGIYLRLSALIEQADRLVIFQMPEPEPRLEQAPAEDWQDRLEQGYQSALTKLSDYVVIRRRETPMATLMDPQWEGLVRQNLRMLLEQAQVALLSGNQVLYRESLERSNYWVAEFFESDAAAARAMAREIDQLADLQIEVEVPDLTRSLTAISGAIERRLEQGGGE